MGTFLLILVLLSAAYPLESKKKFRRLYFLAVKYESDIEYVNNFEIKITPGNASIDILMDVGKDVDSIWSRTAIQLWLKNIKDFKQIFIYELNLCQNILTSNKDKTNLLNAWVQNVFKFGNLTKKCPIDKNVYYIPKLKPDKESIPAFAPAGRVRLLTSIFTTQKGFKETLGSTEFDIELK